MRRQYAVVGVAILLLLGGCSTLGGGGSTATPAADDAPTPTASDLAGAPTASPADEGTPTASPAAGGTPTPDDGTPTGTPTSASDDTTVTPTATPTPTPTATPTPDPATEDLAPVSSMDSLPPGVNATAVTDEETLFGAHRDGVASGDTAFGVRLKNRTETVLTVERANDSTVRRIDLRSGSESGDRLSYYFADPVYATYNSTSGIAAYTHGDVPLAGDAVLIDIAVTGLGTSWLRAVEWEPVGVRTVDGEQRLVFDGTSLNRTDARSGGTLLPPLLDGEDDENGVESVEARMTVTAEGLVRRANLTIAGETSGTAARRTLELATEPFTTDLSEPDWLADAPRAELDAAEDGRLLVFDHTGGPAIDEGAELSVTADGSPVGNVTLPESVESGETVYVHRTGDGGLAVSVNERPTVPDGATPFAGQVLVTGSDGDVRFRAGVDREDS